MALIVDFETASLASIKPGVYPYLNDPTTKIVVLAVLNTDTRWRGVWDIKDSYGQNDDVIKQVNHSVKYGEPFFAHNAAFEFVAFDKFPSLKPRPEQWNCTAAMARRAGLMSGLGPLTKLLGIETKDSAGKQLINFFHSEKGYKWLMGIKPPELPPLKSGKPRKVKIHPSTVKIEGVDITFDEAFLKYGNYCLKDVEVTELLLNKLKFFLPEGNVKEYFIYDLEMNKRGFPVDVAGLEIAHRLYIDADCENKADCYELTMDDITGIGINPSQRAKLLAWLQSEGWEHNDLKASTVESSLEWDQLSPSVRAALEMRQMSSFSAVKKIPAMLKAQVGGRIRGGFMWAGAVRTHRSSGKGVQPQNLKRPDKAALSFTRAMLASAPADHLSDIHGPLIERLANSVRHFIREPEGNMWDVDFSQIEARLTLYVCGQNDILDGYRQNKCAYSLMGSKIFKKPYEQVKEEEGIERFVGKQAVLLCGYAGGASKFADTCASYGQDIGIDLAEEAVSGYRLTCPKVARSWKEINRAAISAILTRPDILPRESLDALDKINFTRGDTDACEGRINFSMHREKTGIDTLLLELYSGHILSYPFPGLRVRTGKRHLCKLCRKAQAEEKKIECDCQEPFSAIGTTYKLYSKGQFNDKHTHGGVYLENICQALAGDHLNFALMLAKEAGFEATMVIHDQAIGPLKTGQNLEDIVKAFQTVPSWAPGFPLKAAAKIVEFYTK